MKMNSHLKKVYDVGISRHIQQQSIICSTMTPRSKLLIRQSFLSHGVARQRQRITQPALYYTIRQLHRSSTSVSHDRRSHHLKISQFSPASSSSWSPTRWHRQDQQRCFTRSIHEDNESISLAHRPNADSEPSSKTRTTTLNFNVNYFLKEIPIGNIHNENIGKARSFLYTAAKWRNERGASISEAILERLYKEQSEGLNSNIIITTEMYNICMDAWNKSNADGETIVTHVEAIMKRMEHRYLLDGEEGKNSYYHNVARSDRIGYNCLINAYSKWEEENSSEKAKDILGNMTASAEAAASSSGDQDYELLIRPDTFTYNSLMNYYASRKDEHISAQRAEDLLLHLSELSKQDNDIELNATSFNIVLKAWGNSGGGIQGAHRAESVLQMMMKLYSHGHENVRPDTISFSTVINAYSKIDPEDASIAMEKVMELLDELEGSYFPESDKNVNSCYNAAANAIVKSGVEDALDRIVELMRRMKNMDAVPDGNILSSLIEVHAAEGSDGSFERGKDLLLEMMDGPETDFEANSKPFNVLLKAMIRGNSLSRAEELMAVMEKIGGNARPDSWTYNMIISALCRDPATQSEQKAVEHLKNMLKSYREGYQKAKPDSFVFNCIISHLARSQQGEWADNVIYRTLLSMESQYKRGNTSVLPDTITYNLVIGKLAQSNTKEHAKKVMKLLENMKSNKAIAPDIITYTNVLRLQERVNPHKAAQIASSYLDEALSNKAGKLQIDRLGFQTLLMCLSRSYQVEHAMMARRAWEHMEKHNAKGNVLNSDLCNLVLVAYSKANHAKAAEEALSFLSERIHRYNEDKSTILPTMVGFGAALVSLGKANRIDDALRILDIMTVLSKDSSAIKPDAGCFMAILGPLAHCQAQNAASAAWKVVKRMKKDFPRIPTAALNAAINTCSKTTGSPIDKRKAVEIALVILQLGREDGSCDDVTYGLMIRTCIKLTDDHDARLKLVQPLFKLAAKSGLVGNMVVREVKQLKTSLIVNDQLPKEWTVNAKDK